MKTNYDFDSVIDRKGSDSVKYDLNDRIFGTDDLLPMWVADMDFEVPDFIRDAIGKRLEHPIYGYTYRSATFYEAVLGWLDRRHSWRPGASSVSFSPGIVPALNMIVMKFTAPGDRVMIQPPVYFPFISAVRNHGRELVHNRLMEKKGNYSIDFDQLEDEFKKGVKLFIFCNPHNPVGRVWCEDELKQIAKLCVKYDVLVISDEVHSDLVLSGRRHIPLASLGKEIADLCFTCVAPSKTFNLAGLYTSVVIATNPELKKGYEQVLDAVHVGGGCLFGQVAFEAAYNHGDQWLEQLLTYLQDNYLFLVDYLHKNAPEVVVSPLEATYLAWLDFRYLELSDEELKQFIIRKAKLGMNDGPMFGPGGNGFQRMNIALSRSRLKEGLEQLGLALNRH